MLDLSKTAKTNKGIFGLDFSFDDSEVVFIPGTWDACSSFRKGSNSACNNVMKYSPQCDLFNTDFPDFVDSGLYLMESNKELINLNKKASLVANSVISELETVDLEAYSNEFQSNVELVNSYAERSNEIIYSIAETCIKANKLIGLIGGNHSCSYGLINALIDYIDSFSILQIDAHMDLRNSYQGFNYSHASIMRNCLEFKDISRLVQICVRDFCEDEYLFMKQSKGRVKTFFDQDIKADLFNGKTWDSICKKIINNCTDNVYVSIDLDGLMTTYSSNTGTPVPGGLSYDHIIYLIKCLSQSKKRIVGFDVVEANGNYDSIDIITATRLLYNVAGYAWLTHQ